MLPILHLNGYKIANPTVLARISHHELESFSLATGASLTLWKDDPDIMHQLMADTLEKD